MIRLAAVLTLLWASGAVAQTNCAPRDIVTARLAGDRYKEVQIGAGLHYSGDFLFEVWASEGGSWTIIATHPSDISCIVASGTNWREAIKVPAGGVPG